jgi:hypothetical protein
MTQPSVGIGSYNLRAAKAFAPGLEPRTVFRGCGICSRNLPVETNNFFLGAVLLPLCYRAKETIFTVTRTQDRLSRLWPLLL